MATVSSAFMSSSTVMMRLATVGATGLPDGLAGVEAATPLGAAALRDRVLVPVCSAVVSARPSSSHGGIAIPVLMVTAPRVMPLR